uniref:Uncharacterized protein n=1 Tax=Streptomyces sp. NBC_00003 TaxID=2903608 RepID=A0AAU2V4B8_9ACTN
MYKFEFELLKYSNKKETGHAGLVGPFGHVTTKLPKTTFWRGKGVTGCSEVQLDGEHLPHTLYRCDASAVRPTLEMGHLSIEGTEVPFDFNRRAFRNKSRALTIRWADRDYRYSVLQLDRRFALERSGAHIGFDRRKSSTGKGTSSFGVGTGNVDSIDLALAIIFEEVDTTALTSLGATSAAINKIYNLPRSNE